MKKFFCVMISFLFFFAMTTSLYASKNFSKKDMDFTFGKASVNFDNNFFKKNVLSETEMKSTKGEWGWSGAFVSVCIRAVSDMSQGKISKPSDLAKSAVIGFANPFDTFGPYPWHKGFGLIGK